MGHPRRISKKYSTPKHPWRAERIEEERGIGRKYGLKNKKEIWKAHANLRDVRGQARKLLAARTAQSEVEKAQLMARLLRLGLLKPDMGIDDILALRTTDFLDRRLQTIVHKLNFSSTIKQARQFITHGHVTINGKRVTSPSYVVRAEEESKIKLIRDFDLTPPKPEKEVVANG
jgi:small subunit ribosomal protein S4